MTKINEIVPNPQPVSTVTKHIKIYSDNPIHDCIDRIIDNVACIDDGHDLMGLAAVELHEAANDLVMLVMDLRKKKSDEIRRRLNAKKSN